MRASLLVLAALLAAAGLAMASAPAPAFALDIPCMTELDCLAQRLLCQLTGICLAAAPLPLPS